MPATSKCRPLSETLLAEFDGLSRSFVDDFRRQRQGKISDSRLDNYRCVARHFLIWLNLTGIELRAVDGSIIQRFQQHECRCDASCASIRLKRWNRRRTSAELMRLVRFLESAGHINTLGELEDNLRLLDAFLAGLFDEGYTANSIKSFRFACTGFIVWLHLSRIRLRDLTSDVFAQYLNREFVCSIPGLFSGRRKQGTEACHGQLRGFFRHLVSIGQIAPLEPVPIEPALPARLKRFALWLERHRGISPKSVRQHVRAIRQMLPALGDDPDRCRGQTMRLAQMMLVGPYATLDLRLGTSRERLGGDHRLDAQVMEKMPDRWRVTRVRGRRRRARHRKYCPGCSELMRLSSTFSCSSHQLKPVASTTRRPTDERAYPCLMAASANPFSQGTSGPSGTCDRTTW